MSATQGRADGRSMRCARRRLGRVRPRGGFLFVAAILGLMACAPERTPQVPQLYVQDFEEICAGVPCGWTLVRGATGAARTTETLLPGLRGLALVGDDVVVDGPDGGDARVDFSFGPTPLTAVLMARCDASASLTIRVGVTSVTTPDGGPDPFAELYEAQLRPESTWSTDGGTSGETRQTLVPLIARDGGTATRRIVSVNIRKLGAGQCEIDSLTIEQSDSFSDGLFVGGCT